MPFYSKFKSWQLSICNYSIGERFVLHFLLTRFDPLQENEHISTGPWTTDLMKLKLDNQQPLWTWLHFHFRNLLWSYWHQEQHNWPSWLYNHIRFHYGRPTFMNRNLHFNDSSCYGIESYCKAYHISTLPCDTLQSWEEHVIFQCLKGLRNLLLVGTVIPLHSVITLFATLLKSFGTIVSVDGVHAMSWGKRTVLIKMLCCSVLLMFPSCCRRL